jgi:transposase
VLSFADRAGLNLAWQQWLSSRHYLDLALYAEIGNSKHFSNGRGASACIGLTPEQHSTGGKTKIGHIGKGVSANTRLRSTLSTGSIAGLNALERRPAKNQKEQWLKDLAARRGKGRAGVALAKKTSAQLGRCWPIARVTNQPN